MSRSSLILLASGRERPVIEVAAAGLNASPVTEDINDFGFVLPNHRNIQLKIVDQIVAI